MSPVDRLMGRPTPNICRDQGQTADGAPGGASTHHSVLCCKGPCRCACGHVSLHVSKHGPHPAPILPLGHPSNLKTQDPQAGGPVHLRNGVPVPMQALGHLGKEFWNPRRQSMAWKGGMGTPPGPRGLLSPRGMARPEKREYRVMV